MSLTFKLVENVTTAQKDALERELKSRGAKMVKQLFPGEKNSRLAALRLVEAPPTEEGLLLEHLQASESVEFAEYAPKRRLK